jgi:hypothetical protein
MTTKQRDDRIKALTTELATLLEQEWGPPPKVKFITACDLPTWLAQALGDAIRRKIAEETPSGH